MDAEDGLSLPVILDMNVKRNVVIVVLTKYPR